MPLTITWQIDNNSLMVMPSQEGQNNVIIAVRYTATGTDNATPPHTATFDSMARFEYKTGNPFIPFAQVTANDVLSWIQSDTKIVETANNVLTNDINRQINPPVRPERKPAPWIS